MSKKGFGLEDKFETAKDKYGIFPTTVWVTNFCDGFVHDLKREVGDGTKYGTSTRYGVFSDQPSKPGRSMYRDCVKESTFNPVVAVWIMNMFGPKTGLVYDPFAGGGTRAIITTKYGLNYVGCEIREEEVLALNNRLKNNEVSDKCKILNTDSRLAPEIESNSADFLITCPPYYDLEKYNGGDNDLSMCKTYDEFLQGIEQVILESGRILKPGALSAWVVGLHRDKKSDLIPIHHDITYLHKKLGFSMREEIIIYWDLKGTGAVKRMGGFEKGNHLLIRAHEYCLIFKNKDQK